MNRYSVSFAGANERDVRKSHTMQFVFLPKAQYLSAGNKFRIDFNTPKRKRLFNDLKRNPPYLWLKGWHVFGVRETRLPKRAINHGQ